jgi:beta-glucosidase
MTASIAAAQPAIAKRTADLLAQMSSAEKYAQMAQVETHSITPDAVRAYGIGSILSGGGGNPTPNTPETWRDMVHGFQIAARESRLGIPSIYGVDAVHGHNNVYGATIFPHNIGLGATRDSELVERVGRISALEIAATGVRWNFAPAVSVARDIRWGRSYESYSQNPDIVSELGAAYTRGLQGPELSDPSAVLASVKHFVGDGGTTWDSSGSYPWVKGWWVRQGDTWHIDQGVCDADEATLRRVHLAPYVAAIAAGARNIMVSYSSWGGLKMHAQHYLLTDVLKGELGFTGFLVSDWLAVDQLAPDYYEGVVTAINAGLDMVMVPYNYIRFFDVMERAVYAGDIQMSRVDDAVSRILSVKFELGLFDHEPEDRPSLAVIGAQSHRELAREAAVKSAVLLKNDVTTLPLSRDLPQLLIAGQGADDIGLQCGGWTIEWQGKPGAITEGKTILDGVRAVFSAETTIQYVPDGTFAAETHAPVGIVVIGEQPYAEGQGDRSQLLLSAENVALITQMRLHCDLLVAVLLSGRPLILGTALAQIDALVAAWLPGSEADGIADLLIGKHPFTGKLPFAWPRDMSQIPFVEDDDHLWPIGHGLRS